MPPGGETPRSRPSADPSWLRRPSWGLTVRLGRLTPTSGTRLWGMVYLYPTAPDREGEPPYRPPLGLPIWFLSRLPTGLKGLPTPGERVPRDRRSLRAWARAVRPLEINVEESDLGTVLEARYRLPEGLHLEARFSSERPGEPRRDHRQVLCASGPVPGPIRWGRPPYQLEVQLER
jgi:hypothetical protein